MLITSGLLSLFAEDYRSFHDLLLNIETVLLAYIFLSIHQIFRAIVIPSVIRSYRDTYTQITGRKYPLNALELISCRFKPIPQKEVTPTAFH